MKNLRTEMMCDVVCEVERGTQSYESYVQSIENYAEDIEAYTRNMKEEYERYGSLLKEERGDQTGIFDQNQGQGDIEDDNYIATLRLDEYQDYCEKQIMMEEEFISEKDLVNAFSVDENGFKIMKNKETKLQQAEFPLESFPLVLKNFAVELAEEVQAPIELCAVTILGGMATSVQGKYQITSKKSVTVPLNLYLLSVSGASNRKSSIMKQVSAPFEKFMEEKMEKRKKEIVERNALIRIYEQKKLKLEKECEGRYDSKFAELLQVITELDSLRNEEKNEVETLFISNSTVEALLYALEQNAERITIMSADAGIIEIFAGKYSKGSADIELLLCAFDGAACVHHRVRNGETKLKNPLITMNLATQEIVLNKMINNVEISEKGLLSRFLVTQPDSIIGTRKARSQHMSDSTRKEYEDLITSFLKMSYTQKPIKLHLDEEALSLAYENEMEIEERLIKDLSSMDAWGGKLYGQQLRIAGLLHLAKHYKDVNNTTVSRDTIESAICIGEYFTNQMKRILFEKNGQRDEMKIDSEYMMERLLKSSDLNKGDKIWNISWRDLKRGCSKRALEGRHEIVRDYLVNEGIIKVEKKDSGKESKGGRPSEIIYVNPLYIDSLN